MVLYYVYKLIDPRNNTPFYIGKGKGNRIDAHEKEANKGGKSKKCALIRAIKLDGYDIEKEIIKRFDKECDAYDYEDKLIKKIGLNNLTNQIPGGITRIFGGCRSEDRIIVRVYTRAVVKTMGFKIGAVYKLCGQSFDIPDSLIRKIRIMFHEVYKRRGYNWTKNQMASMGVLLNIGE